MGKSALTIVASQQIPVYPTCHKKDCIRQPPYTRSAHTFAHSGRLLAFRSCVANQLAGARPGTQAAVRSAFASAARGCAGRGGSMSRYEGGEYYEV